MSNTQNPNELTGKRIFNLTEDEHSAFVDANVLPAVDSIGVIVGLQGLDVPLCKGGIPVVWWTEPNAGSYFQCDQVQGFTGATAVYVEDNNAAV